MENISLNNYGSYYFLMTKNYFMDHKLWYNVLKYLFVFDWFLRQCRQFWFLPILRRHQTEQGATRKMEDYDLFRREVQNQTQTILEVTPFSNDGLEWSNRGMLICTQIFFDQNDIFLGNFLRRCFLTVSRLMYKIWHPDFFVGQRASYNFKV